MPDSCTAELVAIHRDCKPYLDKAETGVFREAYSPPPSALCSATGPGRHGNGNGNGSLAMCAIRWKSTGRSAVRHWKRGAWPYVCKFQASLDGHD